MSFIRARRRLHFLVQVGELDAESFCAELARVDYHTSALLLRHTYWYLPAVHVDVLHAGFLFLEVTTTDAVARVLGLGPVIVACPTCDNVQHAHSRGDVDGIEFTQCVRCQIQSLTSRSTTHTDNVFSPEHQYPLVC